MNRYTSDERRLIIDLDNCGDQIMFAREEGGTIGIEIDEPMAGSTDTGFGSTTYATLTRNDVAAFLNWYGPQAIREILEDKLP